MAAILLAQFVVKGAVVLLAAWALARLMRRASAAARHLVWTAGIAATLALPLVPILGPTWTVAVPASWSAAGTAAEPAPLSPPLQDVSVSQTPASALEPAAASALPASIEAPPLRDYTPTPASPSGATRITATQLIVALWLIGMTLLIARLVYGLKRVSRITRDATPVSDPGWLASFDEAAAALQIDRKVQLRQSDRTTVPVACGMWRPAVLLPREALRWSEERRLVVLLHELAHVRRRDCLVQSLAQLMCAMHWINPLAHVALARLRSEQERACDDLVLEAGADAPQYADHLFEIARSFRAPATPAWATLAMARPSQLEGRLMAILDDECNRRPLARRMRLTLGTAAAAALVALGALQVTAASPGSSVTSSVTFRLAQGAAPALGTATTDTETEASSVHETNGRVTSSSISARERRTKEIAGDHATMTANEAIEAAFALPLPEPGPAPLPSVGFLPAAFTFMSAQQPPVPPAPPAAQGPPVSDETRRRVADALATALSDENEDVREQALNSLVSMRDARALPALLKALRDPSVELRERAVNGLAQFDTPEANDALLTALKDSSPDVREHAARHLGSRMGRGQLQDQKYVDAFLALLKDPTPDVREEAAMMAGRSRNRAAVPALLPLLKDMNVDVRERAAQALGMIADPSAIDGLTAALKDPSPDVREQAAMALGQIARGQRRGRDFVPPIPPTPPRPIVKLDTDAIAKLAEQGAARGVREAERAMRNLDLKDFDKVFDKDFEKKIEESIESALESLER